MSTKVLSFNAAFNVSEKALHLVVNVEGNCQRRYSIYITEDSTDVSVYNIDFVMTTTARFDKDSSLKIHGSMSLLHYIMSNITTSKGSIVDDAIISRITECINSSYFDFYDSFKYEIYFSGFTIAKRAK